MKSRLKEQGSLINLSHSLPVTRNRKWDAYWEKEAKASWIYNMWNRTKTVHRARAHMEK